MSSKINNQNGQKELGLRQNNLPFEEGKECIITYDFPNIFTRTETSNKKDFLLLLFATLYEIIL